MNSKLLIFMLCITLSVTALTGCASEDDDVKDLIAADGSDSRIVAASSDLSSDGADSASSDGVLNTDHSLNPDDMFTDRDKEIGYDEASCVKISLSDGASTCDSSGVTIDGDIVTITGEGTYLLSGSLTDGQIIVDSDNSKIRLILDNANINCNTSAAIYVRAADKVFITLAADSANCLSNTEDFIAIDDNNIDAVIFSKSDLTLNGSGALSINAVYGHGILSKDDLKFTGGTYSVSAASSALSGKDSVRIADSSFNLTAGKDGIHSENADDEEKGFIYIAGGNFQIDADSDGLDSSCTMQIDGGAFNISAADDAFHSDTDLIVNGGDIHISSCYEGLEGQTITINDGSIDLCSTDDGLNAAGGNDQSGFGNPKTDDIRNDTGSTADCSITINGGTVNINADGDGIDSNGDLTVNGGEIFVSGPTDNANGPLDYGGSAKITGGSIIAVGSSQMAQNFGSESTQGAILIRLDSYAEAGTDITLKDSDGNILISYTAEKKYDSILISCPDITDGGTYTVAAGDSETAVTMDGLIYGSGMGDSMGGMRNGIGDMGDDMGDMGDDMGGMGDDMGGMRNGMKDMNGNMENDIRRDEPDDTKDGMRGMPPEIPNNNF